MPNCTHEDECKPTSSPSEQQNVLGVDVLLVSLSDILLGSNENAFSQGGWVVLL